MAYTFSPCMLGLKLQNRPIGVSVSRRNKKITFLALASAANVSPGKKSSGDDVIMVDPLDQAKRLTEKQIGDKQIGDSKKEFNFHVFFHEIFEGAGKTSDIVIDPKSSYPNFGRILVIDVPLWESRKADKIIARAQGISVSSDQKQGGWYLSWNILFEMPEFKESTLKVMGNSLDTEISKELSIVGGTGVFTLARGMINGRVLESADNTLWIELKIQGDYMPVKPPSWD